MKMCESFAKNGHNVVLYARKSNEHVNNVFNYYGVERCFLIRRYPSIPVPFLGLFSYIIKVNKVITKSEKPDLIYGRDVFTLFAIAHLGCRFVLETHKPPITFIHKYFTNYLIKNKSLSHLVVISNALKKEYTRIYPRLNKKILVVHDAANLPNSEDIQMGETSLPIKKGQPNIGYVGHLYPGKGMELIVRLAKVLPHLKFNIIGGTEKDIKYWRKKSTNNIQFHGFVPHGCLAHYYISLDILLAPYQKKVAVHGGHGDVGKWMSPLKIFEYMAFSKAIVASDLPVLREILVNRKNCLLCAPEDIESWKSALLELTNDIELRTNIGKEAYRELSSTYTWLKRAENVLI